MREHGLDYYHVSCELHAADYSGVPSRLCTQHWLWNKLLSHLSLQYLLEKQC